MHKHNQQLPNEPQQDLQLLSLGCTTQHTDTIKPRLVVCCHQSLRTLTAENSHSSSLALPGISCLTRQAELGVSLVFQTHLLLRVKGGGNPTDSHPGYCAPSYMRQQFVELQRSHTAHLTQDTGTWI